MTDATLAPPEANEEQPGEVSPVPEPPPTFPPYPPYAVERAPPSVADAIIAGHDLRVQHKSLPKKAIRPAPKPARPRGPKATDVKMTKRVARAHARCLRRNNALMTDRLEQMSKPAKRHVMNLWRQYADVLPADMIARLRSLLDADEPLKPEQAYEYFINMKKSRKRSNALRLNEMKKDMQAVYTDKRFKWARNATVAFAKGIQQRLSKPGCYMLADGMLRLSNIILHEICGCMRMRTPSRRCAHPKAKFMMEMADKVAVWIDEILTESDDRMLMMDYDEDEDVLNADETHDTGFTDDFLNMMGGPGEFPRKPRSAYLNFTGDMLDAFNILTNSMYKNGNSRLMSHGKYSTSYKEGADELKQAQSFDTTKPDRALAEQIKQNLTKTIAPLTPAILAPTMKDILDICSNYLAELAENNKEKGPAFKLLVNQMKAKGSEMLYSKGKSQRRYSAGAKDLDESKSGLEADHDDPNLSKEIHEKLSKDMEKVTPPSLKDEMKETLDICSKYLSERAVDERGLDSAASATLKSADERKSNAEARGMSIVAPGARGAGVGGAGVGTVGSETAGANANVGTEGVGLVSMDAGLAGARSDNIGGVGSGGLGTASTGVGSAKTGDAGFITSKAGGVDTGSANAGGPVVAIKNTGAAAESAVTASKTGVVASVNASTGGSVVASKTAGVGALDTATTRSSVVANKSSGFGSSEGASAGSSNVAAKSTGVGMLEGTSTGGPVALARGTGGVGVGAGSASAGAVGADVGATGFSGTGVNGKTRDSLQDEQSKKRLDVDQAKSHSAKSMNTGNRGSHYSGSVDEDETDPERAGALSILHKELRGKGASTLVKQSHTELTHAEASEWLMKKPNTKVDKTIKESGDTERLHKKFERKLSALVSKKTPTPMQDIMQDVVIESARVLSELFVAQNYKALSKNGLISEMQKRGNEILVEVDGTPETFFFAAQRLKKADNLAVDEPCDQALYYLSKQLDDMIRCRPMPRKVIPTMKEHIKDAASYLSEHVTKPDEQIEAYVALLGEMESTGDTLLIEGEIPKTYKDAAAYLRQLTSFEDRINRPNSSLQSATVAGLKKIMANVPPLGYTKSVLDNVINDSARLLVSYIMLQVEKTKALKILVDRLDEAGQLVLLRHGAIRKTHSDGAELLRGMNADQLNEVNADPVASRKIQIKLINLMRDHTPSQYEDLMYDVIEDVTMYLAVKLLQSRTVQVCECMRSVLVQCELWCDEILRRVARPCCVCSRRVSAPALAELAPAVRMRPASAHAPGIEIDFRRCPTLQTPPEPCPGHRDRSPLPCPAYQHVPTYTMQASSQLKYSPCYSSPVRTRKELYLSNRSQSPERYSPSVTRTQSPERYSSPTRSPSPLRYSSNLMDPQTPECQWSTPTSSQSHMHYLSRLPRPKTPAHYLPTPTHLDNPTRYSSMSLYHASPIHSPVSSLNAPHLPQKHESAMSPNPLNSPCPSSNCGNCSNRRSFSARTPSPCRYLKSSSRREIPPKSTCTNRTSMISTDEMSDWHAMMISLMWNVQAWRDWIQENIDRALSYNTSSALTPGKVDEKWVVFQRKVATEALQWRQYNIFSRELTMGLAMRYGDKKIVSPTRATNKTKAFMECQQEMLAIIEMFNKWTQWLIAIVKETDKLAPVVGSETSLNDVRWLHFKKKVEEYSEDWFKYNTHLKVCWENKYRSLVSEWGPSLVPAGAVWVVSACGAVPSGAVPAGLCGGELIWVARTTHRCSVMPAALHPSKHCCIVYADGGVHHYTKYQVMCNAPARWVRCRGGAGGARAVRVARGVLVGRVRHRDTHLVGAVRPPAYRCHVVLFGRSYAFNCYELLVIDEDQ